MKKKGNKRMPTPQQKLIYDPIPTSLFLSDIYLLFVRYYCGHNYDTFLTKSMFTQTTKKDVGMGL